MAWLALDRALRIADTHRLSKPSTPTLVHRTRRDRRTGARPRLQTTLATATRAATAPTSSTRRSWSFPSSASSSRTDPASADTIDAIERDLGAGGPLLYRYPPGDDGLPGTEGAFLPCAFWLVQALAKTGRVDEATERFAALLELATPLGLYAEEMDPTATSISATSPSPQPRGARPGRARHPRRTGLRARVTDPRGFVLTVNERATRRSPGQTDAMAPNDQVLQRIVIGTDGSEHATTAVRWAAEEAAIHGATLVAMQTSGATSTNSTPKGPAPLTPSTTRTVPAPRWWRGSPRPLGTPARPSSSESCWTHPRVRSSTLATQPICSFSALAAYGGFEGLLLGSVSERVAQLANKPVAVVRGDAPVRQGRVVAGVDGLARSLEALRWAAAEAPCSGADLDVVHAWRLPMVAPRGHLFDAGHLDDGGRRVARTLNTAVADPGLAAHACDRTSGVTAPPEL